MRRRFVVPLPGDRSLVLGDRAQIMGVINVTPDSFSDGGVRFDPARAIDDGVRMVDEGVLPETMDAAMERFGMPMGAGGPHAAYMACRDDFKRALELQPDALAGARGRRRPALPHAGINTRGAAYIHARALAHETRRARPMCAYALTVRPAPASPSRPARTGAAGMRLRRVGTRCSKCASACCCIHCSAQRRTASAALRPRTPTSSTLGTPGAAVPAAA